MSMDRHRTHVIELNEFNLELLRRAATELSLSSIKRILDFTHGITVADQETEHQGLDPWVQWVSVHAEVPSQTHGIIRLGDVVKLKHPQIWERLSKRGVSTGVWGVMNASRREASANAFFFADPWTFSEAPFPSQLQDFLALPVYYAKNYMSLAPAKLLASAARTSRFIVANASIPTLISDAWFLLKQAFGTKFDSCFLFVAFELISCRLFAKYRERFSPDATFVFINSIAHFQHHEWKGNGAIDRKAAFVFRSIDRILSILLPSAESMDRVLVLNGLSQRNVENESMYCYRQIDPHHFLKTIGIDFAKVEQCMTNDGHVFFHTPAECMAAAALLRQGRINGAPAFYVEIDSENPCKLFYQVAYWGVSDANSKLCFDNLELPFLSQFAVHAKRTGAHLSQGDYFSSGLTLPPRVENARILSYLWPA